MNRPGANVMALVAGACVTLSVGGCVGPSSTVTRLTDMPAVDEYCLAAQRVIARTELPMQLVVHTDFDDFVKSKAVIEGPTIHQYNWFDADGGILGISCKMKSADHLNLVYGDGVAGPEGYCHDMNREVYRLLGATRPELAEPALMFDPSESLNTPEQQSMIGPVWLLPFTLSQVDAAGTLHVATKGFVIEFGDPRYQKFPPSWRGTHYCHLIAPDYLQALLTGRAEPGAEIGRAARQRRVPTSVTSD